MQSEYLAGTLVSAGHDACQPVGTRWVGPVVGSTNFAPVHPNALGERAMADRAIAVLGLDRPEACSRDPDRCGRGPASGGPG